MMAADEHLLLQRTLQNLDYHEIFDDKSIPLLKKLLLDMKVLSEHANELQRENSILRSKNTTAGSNEDSNETYILDVVNMANDKIENLTRDLNLLRRENADLKSRDFEKSFKNEAQQFDDAVKLSCLDFLKDLAKFMGQISSPGTHSMSDMISDVNDIQEAVIFCQQLLTSAKRRFTDDFDGQTIPKLKQSNVELEKKLARLSGQLLTAEALNAQLNSASVTFETQKTLLEDITCQMSVLDRLNNSLQNVLRQIELSNSTQDVSNQVSALLEVLLAELGTELSFSSHLSKITDKMNQRLSNQEKTISELRKQLSDALSELSQSKEKCVQLVASSEAFECANKDLNVKLEQLNSALSVVKSSHNRDQKTISELQNAIKSTKDSSESSKIVLRKLKHQEESIRSKNLDLESKIDSLQRQLDLKTRELVESERSIQSLKCEVTSIKSHGDLKQNSIKNVEHELTEMKSSFENTKIDLEAARKKCTDLETEITAKKKEKDLMMVTHFKLIKSNEKISSELEFCKKELQRMKSSEIPSKDQISALAQELEVQKMQTLSYMEQSHSLKSKLQECEERIHKSSADIHVYKNRIGNLESELNSAKNQIQVLERSRADNFFQLAKLTEKLNDVKSGTSPVASNTFKLEQLIPKQPIISSKNWKDEFPEVTLPEPVPLFDSFFDSVGSSQNDEDAYTANGIIHDWARKNKELRDHLKYVQEELKNEVSFAVGDATQNLSEALIIEHADKKMAVESEHQVLMDIVSRVKSDLRQAALTSPGSPNL